MDSWSPVSCNSSLFHCPFSSCFHAAHGVSTAQRLGSPITTTLRARSHVGPGPVSLMILKVRVPGSQQVINLGLWGGDKPCHPLNINCGNPGCLCFPSTDQGGGRGFGVSPLRKGGKKNVCAGVPQTLSKGLTNGNKARMAMNSYCSWFQPQLRCRATFLRSLCIVLLCGFAGISILEAFMIPHLHEGS